MMKSFQSKNSIVALLVITSLLLLMSNCATKPSTMKTDVDHLIKLVKLETRTGITQKFMLIKPNTSVASVVLLEGARGRLKLQSFLGKPYTGGGKGVLERNRENFANHDFMVALVDAPSDKQTKGMIDLFRTSSEHARDMHAVITYLKREENIPIWLVGFSMGTFSTANAAIRLGKQIDGLILISSNVRGGKTEATKHFQNGILDMSLEKITVPTLLLAHKNDKCQYNPPEGAAKIQKRLINAPIVKVNYFSGGKRSISHPCYPLSSHGFYGLDEEVLTTIAEFIKSN